MLRVTDGELTDARRQLRALGIRDGRAVIAIHPGASHPIRRLREDVVAAAAARITRSGATAVLIEGPQERVVGSFPPGLVTVTPSLRGLMGLLATVDGLVCSDSGAMHIATAFGTPVTAVFGPQRHEWLGPREPFHRIVSVSEMPCRPCFDACIYATPLCMDRVGTDMVLEALDAQLASLAARAKYRDTAPAVRAPV